MASSRSSASASSSGVSPGSIDLSRHGEHRLHVGALAQQARVEPAGRDGILDVVHGVGDVVGPVHDLGLGRPVAVGGAGAEPVEDVEVVVVDAELHGGVRRPAAAPRVLRGGVQAGPGEVEPGRAAVGVGALGLQAGEQSQRLGVALEAADAGRDGVEGGLPVVPERRVAEVVGEAGGVDDVGAAAQGRTELAADLGDLERVGEPVAHEVVAGGLDDLGLGRQPAQARGVEQAGPVAGEVVAVGTLVGGVLGDPALAVALGVRHAAHPRRAASAAAAARSTHLGSTP